MYIDQKVPLSIVLMRQILDLILNAGASQVEALSALAAVRELIPSLDQMSLTALKDFSLRESDW